jgi:hypothetical protein
MVGKVRPGALHAALKRVFAQRPDLETQLRTDPAGALAKAAGVIEATAGTGEMSISGAEIMALRAARFDHQNGAVLIGSTSIQAPFVQFGGTGSGQTTITGGTESRSRGTSIKVGGNASIKIKGNASIKQS